MLFENACISVENEHYFLIFCIIVQEILLLKKQASKSVEPDQQPRHRRACWSGSTLFRNVRRSLFAWRRSYDSCSQAGSYTDNFCRSFLYSCLSSSSFINIMHYFKLIQMVAFIHRFYGIWLQFYNFWLILYFDPFEYNFG